MKSKEIEPILIFGLSFLNYFLWQFIETPLNNEFLELQGEISELQTSFIEIAKYLVISLLLTIVILFPFYQNTKFIPKLPYSVSGTLFILSFTIAGYILDQNIKGIYLVRYIGDDFPFIIRIIEFFLFFPLMLFTLIRLTIADIRKRNVIVFFVIGWLATFLAYRVNGNIEFLDVRYFRKAVSQGNFVFWFTLLIGLQCFLINRSEKSHKQNPSTCGNKTM